MKVPEKEKLNKYVLFKRNILISFIQEVLEKTALLD